MLYAVLQNRYILLDGLQPMIFSMENRKCSARGGQVFSILLELTHIDYFAAAAAVFWCVFYYLFLYFVCNREPFGVNLAHLRTPETISSVKMAVY